MKKLIIVILVLSANMLIAQDSEFIKLWNKYHDECSVIVNDTLTETGTVTYDINPVCGDLKLVPVDTTWIVVGCNEYKEWNINWSNIRGDSVIGSLGFYKKSERERFTTSITRKKVCRMKLRRPTFDGFWEWLKENGYRK